MSRPPGKTGKRAAGFTLIEMVIVLALIGLLLTLAVPRYFSALDNGKVKVQQQNLSTMRDAIDKFFGDRGRYPDTLDDLVQKHYLRSVPLDPLTEKSNWLIVVPSDPTLGGVYDVHSATDAHDEN
ncbi:type II secretion system protein [Paraherbaspirillum soli]|uniref:Type II secretion system protein n=1 Tax=Paraherbaspirillum soli TaxID=631222 RepID=A0ABW0M9D3_9BURK